MNIMEMECSIHCVRYHTIDVITSNAHIVIRVMLVNIENLYESTLRCPFDVLLSNPSSIFVSKLGAVRVTLIYLSSQSMPNGYR